MRFPTGIISGLFLLTFAVIFLFLISPAQAYTFTLKGADASNPNNAIAPSAYWSGVCTTNTTVYVTAGAAGLYSLSEKWYSPSNTERATAVYTYPSNITCQIQNTIPVVGTTSNNRFYEAVFNNSYSAQTSKSYISTTYNCVPDTQDYFIYNNTWYNDTLGNHPYAYLAHGTTCFVQSPGSCTNDLTGDVNTMINVIINGHNPNCGTVTLNKDRWGDDSGVLGNCGSIVSFADINEWTLIPFNSMESGIVEIKINPSSGKTTWGTLGKAYQYYLYDTILNTTENLGTTNPYAANKTLIPNRDYWLFLGLRLSMDNMNCGTNNENFTYFYSNYSIKTWAYAPNWNCTDWSVCAASARSRYCNDLNGILSDKIETESCAPLTDISFLNNLGFEESKSQLVSFCSRYSFALISCNSALNNITSQIPVNWSIASGYYDSSNVLRQNFLEITSEAGAREGTKSLKMWYIPPKDDEPMNDGSGGTICGNVTTGAAPEVDTPYNETLFLAANVSFPSPFMDLRYSIKKCAAPVLQYDYTGDWFGINCGKRCYASACNETPKGIYGIRLMDTSDNSLVIDINGIAGDNWADYVADLSNKGLKTNHNYTLAVAVNPQNSQDPYSSCIYFDKIQATIRKSGIISCVSYCDSNYTRYEAISTNPCIYSIKPSALCVADTTKSGEMDQVLTGQKNYTCIGNNAWSYDSASGALVETPNAPLCIAQNAATNQTAPPSTITEYTNAFLSVDFILTLILACILIGITLKKPEAWPAGVFGICLVIFELSIKNIISPFIAWGEIIIGVLFLAYFISKPAGG